MTIAEIEKLRKKVVTHIIAAAIITGILVVALIIIFGRSELFKLTPFFMFFPIFLGAFIFSILYLALCHFPTKRFKTAFKLSIVAGALNESFTDTNYDPHGFFPKSDIKDSLMVATGNRYSGDDLISAKYKNIPFRSCDLLIQNHTSNGKSSSTVTYFKGKWFIFDFPKFKNLYLRIIEKKGGATKAGTFFSDLNVKKVALESEQFNREFEVKSNDSHMAFYIVTPVFMEDLKKLSAHANGQLIVGINGGKLHVAVHTNRNSMEPHIFTPVSDASIQTIKDEIKTITVFIDHLIENKKLFGDSRTAQGEIK